MADLVKPPTGRTTGAVTYDGTASRGLFRTSMPTDVGEYVPELIHPGSVREYERISRKTHVGSLIRATRLPIESFDWHINQGSAAGATTERVAANLGLAIGRDGEEPDQRDCIHWRQHLRWALSAPLVFGHAYFELAASIKQGGPYAGAFWLDALEPRPQNTLMGAVVRRDGSVDAIEQQGFNDPRPTLIPASRLLGYVFDAAPGDAWGSPILRSVYESEFYRDMLVRFDAEFADRAAVPTVYAQWTRDEPENPAVREQAEAAVAGFRGGGGLVLPPGYTLQAVQMPTASSALASAKHHEQKISDAFMAGVLELGTTGQGNRALGDTFQELWFLGLKSIAGFIAEVTTNHLIRRMVDWTEGPDAPAPVVGFYAGDDPEPTLTDLKAGIESGAIRVSDDVVEATHSRLGLPKPEVSAGPGAQTPTPPVEPAENLPPVEVTAAAATSREPSLVEAAVDFKAIDRAFQRARQRLVRALGIERDAAIDRLVDDVRAAGGDLDALSALDAGPVGTDALTAAAVAMAVEGAADAVSEAKRQGVEVPAPDVPQERLATRAQAQALTLGGELSGSARGKALELAAAGVGREAVAELVADHLEALTDAGLERTATATLTGALGEGRSAGQRAAAEVATGRYYGSAILDANACLAPESMVLTTAGYVRADEANGHALLTHTGQAVVPSAVVVSEVEGELVRIELDGVGLRATPNHRVFIARGDRFAWVEAGQVAVGDFMVSDASLQGVSEVIGVDGGLADSPDDEATCFQVGGLPCVRGGAQRVPVVAVSLDDQVSALEVNDPRADLALGYEAQPHPLHDFAHPPLDRGLTVGGHIAAAGAVASLALCAGDDPEGGPAVGAVDVDRRSPASLGAVPCGAHDATPDRLTTSLASGVVPTVRSGALAGAVVVPVGVAGVNAELGSAADTDLDDLRAPLAEPAFVGIGAGLVALPRAVALTEAPTPRDLSTAGLALLGREVLRPAGGGSAAPAAPGLARLAATKTQSVHDRIVLTQVVGISREQYAGPVYDFVLEEDHTFFANGALVHNCDACAADDGREFTSLDDAEQVYPGGSHHVECDGGSRCRCLVVQVFDEETEATR